MSRSGHVWDDAAMESFVLSPKTERIARKVYRTCDAARADVFDYIERFYNPKRRHSAIDTVTSQEEEQVGSVFYTSWAGLDMFKPAGHIFLLANGRDAAPGWPSSQKLEAPDLSSRRELCELIQFQAFQDLPYTPLGQVIAPTGDRATLSGALDRLPLFCNVKLG
jgi:hypothetical protein